MDNQTLSSTFMRKMFRYRKYSIMRHVIICYVMYWDKIQLLSYKIIELHKNDHVNALLDVLVECLT